MLIDSRVAKSLKFPLTRDDRFEVFRVLERERKIAQGKLLRERSLFPTPISDAYSYSNAFFITYKAPAALAEADAEGEARRKAGVLRWIKLGLSMSTAYLSAVFSMLILVGAAFVYTLLLRLLFVLPRRGFLQDPVLPMILH